ncbi:MAG TPA: septal ring lytic transglycosylase RlpA family protein, partial [Patescibacteria group bacterium]|nr:septal ring lytic transglycosylase RlpA family protein [Patescibacteria group bacterium]
LVSERIYEYEIYDPMAFNHKIALEFEFRGQDFSDVVLHYWDFSQNAWLPFPQSNQTLGKDGVLRGMAYATTLRMALLRDNFRDWGEASWYKYKNCDCAASPFYPKGTKLLVTHLYNDKQVVVVVNDFGPERDVFPNRVIDLDFVAFCKIANPGAGVIDVHVQVVPDDFVLDISDSTNEPTQEEQPHD